MKTTKERKRLSALLTKASKIKKEKNAKGFTLVELIVVIAIIGVLAVVLVPNMLSYIDKAALSTANDTAAKIAEQANLIAVDLESRGVSVDGKYGNGDGCTAINFSETDTDKFDYQLLKAVPDLKSSDQIAISIVNGKVEYVVFAENATTNEVGTYPKLSNIDDVDGKNFTNFDTGAYAKSGASSDIES